MSSPSQSVRDLIQNLDAAAALPSTAAVCEAVKTALVETIAQRGLELPAAFTEPSAEGYARRLLHAGDDYAVVVMVWGTGQGTPIHDHDGKWCVEGVYEGTIRITSYDLIGEPGDEIVSFREEQQSSAGRGQAGALIPPLDYHVIENVQDAAAVTIHVYGGEMHGCDIYTPVEGDQYRRERRTLSYTA